MAEKIDKFVITFPKGVYIKGEVVKGTLHIKLNEPLKLTTIYVKARGFVSTHWTIRVPVQRAVTRTE